MGAWPTGERATAPRIAAMRPSESPSIRRSLRLIPGFQQQHLIIKLMFYVADSCARIGIRGSHYQQTLDTSIAGQDGSSVLEASALQCELRPDKCFSRSHQALAEGDRHVRRS